MNFNIFGRKKDAAPIAPAELVAPTPETVVETTIDDQVKAALGDAGTTLVNEVATAEADRTLDVAPAAEVTPSAEVALEEIKNLSETPTAASTETSEPLTSEEYQMPSQIVEANSGLLSPQAVEQGEQTSQAIVDTAEPTLGLSEMSDVEVREGFGLEPIPEQPLPAATSETPELDESEATSIAQQEVPAKGQE